MKTFFFEYEDSKQTARDIWDEPKAIFVFDTNIFLKLYGFHEESRQKIYEALDKIKERLWSPHQVMLEFHRNKDYHIEGNKNIFNKADDFIAEFLEPFSEPFKRLHELKRTYKNNFPALGNLIDPFIEDAEKESTESLKNLHKAFKEKLAPIEEQLSKLKSQLIVSKDQDSLYQKLGELYPDDKIGKAFTQTELDQIYKEGAQRYQNQVPPGYGSKSTDIYHYRGSIYQTKFGDLILYKQILDHCKTHKIKNVIFISEDNAKGDWIDKNTKAIHKEIRGEVFEVAGIENFVMINMREFSEYSQVDEDNLFEQDLNQADVCLQLREIGNLSDIGDKIYQIVKDDSINVEDKIALLGKIKGSKLSGEDYWAAYYSFKEKRYSIPYKIATLEIEKDYVNILAATNHIIKLYDVSVDEKISILQYLCDDSFARADVIILRKYLNNQNDDEAQKLILNYISQDQLKKSSFLKTYRKWTNFILHGDLNKEERIRLWLAHFNDVDN